MISRRREREKKNPLHWRHCSGAAGYTYLMRGPSHRHLFPPSSVLGAVDLLRLLPSPGVQKIPLQTKWRTDVASVFGGGQKNGETERVRVMSTINSLVEGGVSFPQICNFFFPKCIGVLESSKLLKRNNIVHSHLWSLSHGTVRRNGWYLSVR